MPYNRSNSSLAVAAGGVFAYVILVSGVWHPKAPAGGLTQVDRRASVAFEDGTVLQLTELESDQDILRRRRMAGWGGHEFWQTFIMADGQEIEVTDNKPGLAQDGDLSSGSGLILAANSRLKADEDVPPPLDSGEKVFLAALQVESNAQTLTQEITGKDWMIEDVLDAKDGVQLDSKDAPVFALATSKAALDEGRFDLMGPDGIWGNLRTTTPLLNEAVSRGGSLSDPPIGAAIPEPSTLPLLGVAGALAGAFGAWRRRRVASC